jgi:hypothetical protein
MNVLEQHIDINLAAQKINSNYYRQLTDSEIDWLLNKHVGRFMKDRIKQDTDSLGFDATEVDMDALRTLVVLDRQLPTFHIEDDATRAELPGDYAFLIDDFSDSIPKCDTAKYKQATTFKDAIVYIYSYPLIQSTTTAPFYKAMSFKLNNSDVFSVSGLTGLDTANELFTVRDYIMGQLSNYVRIQLLDNPAFNIDFYWERFGSFYSPNSFLAVSTTQQSVTNSITIDGTVTNATENTITRNFVPQVSGGKLCANRLVRGHFRSNLRTSAFARTSSDSPISALNGNQVKIYHDGKFIISKLKVSYIRKPAKISLFLNQNCDLAEEFHNEINDRVVLDIKELIMSPDWEIKLRDMMTNKD